jgi:ribosomal protection tetracycline resistance protein
VLPEQPESRRELYEALALLAEEDPLLELSQGGAAQNNKLRLFGEVQTEILKELLWERFGLPVAFSEAATIYMEAPTAAAASRTHIGSKGNPFAAGIGLRVEPLQRGRGLEYETGISFGDLEKPFQRAVEEAVYETCRRGVYGWEITDARVIFEFSQYDSVSSTPSDFRDLVPPVLMEAFMAARMELLEPILEFELRVPEKAASKALYDCQRLRADIATTQAGNTGLLITGLIPADTCKGYNTQVASYTEGQGVFLTKIHGYRSAALEASKINSDMINPAVNKAVYMLHKLGAR